MHRFRRSPTDSVSLGDTPREGIGGRWVFFEVPWSLALSLFLGLASCSSLGPLDDPRETHLRNLHQLTFHGENAEAYFSPQDDKLAFQATTKGWDCDQIFTMALPNGSPKLVSPGFGRTTCAYYLPDGKRVLFASTHEKQRECPPRPDYSQGYVWALYDYDLYVAREDGTELESLFASPEYDAEATISPDGTRIVFTSAMDGDLELYTMNLDGTGLKRLTHTPGYDGGAFFSPDSKKIVFRGHHPKDKEALEEYRTLLKDDKVRPSVMEIFVMDADGGNPRQITNNGKANFAPYWHPDGERIIFASNMSDPRGRNFDLYLIHADGMNLEQITFNETFDSFPMFTRDGSKLVFASNRHNAKQGDTNIFLADWVD